MDIKLRLDYIEKRPRQKFFGCGAVTDILQYLEKHGLLEKVNYLSVDYSKRKKKIPSTEWIMKESRLWKNGVFELLADKENQWEFTLRFVIDETSLSFFIETGETAAAEFNKNSIRQWKQLLIELNIKYLKNSFFGPTMTAEVYEIEYPKPRPRRNHPLVKDSDIISVFSKNFQQEHPDGNIKELNRLLGSKLPPSVSVEEQGDLIFIHWIDSGNLADERRMKKSLSERDEFLAEELNAPIASGWNEFGDKEFLTVMLSEHSLLTFYEDFDEVGFKAVAVDKKGKGADEEIAKLAKWIKDEKLPDDTPVSSIGIIVPGRENALAVRERAKKSGITDIFYIDDEGRWWNPFSSD